MDLYFHRDECAASRNHRRASVTALGVALAAVIAGFMVSSPRAMGAGVTVAGSIQGPPSDKARRGDCRSQGTMGDASCSQTPSGTTQAVEPVRGPSAARPGGRSPTSSRRLDKERIDSLLGPYLTTGRYREAIARLLPFAEEGNPEAQVALGELYLSVRPPSYEQALAWLREAAAQDYSQAKVVLGMLHLRGIGVPKNPDKGLALLRQASKQGNANARRLLEVME